MESAVSPSRGSSSAAEQDALRGDRMTFPSILRELFKVKAIPPKAKLQCVECERRLKRHDKYKILAVKHLDCGDPKNVGQTSIPLTKEEQ
jgi:hypothetical protein